MVVYEQVTLLFGKSTPGCITMEDG